MGAACVLAARLLFPEGSKISTLPRLRHWCLQRGGVLFTAG